MTSSRLLQRPVCRVIGIIGLSSCFWLTGCGAGATLSPGPGSANAAKSNQGSLSNGTGTGGVAGGEAAGGVTVGEAKLVANGSTRTISTFGGGSFDPQGLFNLYSDRLYVTEEGNTVYVSWESFSNGDMVYTSIAQNGVWAVTDKPVYSLSSLSGDGDWSALFSGDRFIIVDRFRNHAYLIEWDASGTVTSERQLYKGWVGGAFGVRVGGELGVALHLPYGAPTGGAKYNFYLPGQGAKPTSVTVGQAQFTGALYALNPKANLLYEAKHVSGTGNPVIDVYQYGVPGIDPTPPNNSAQTAQGVGNTSGGAQNNAQNSSVGSAQSASQASGSSGSSVLINTVPLTHADGSLVQTTVSHIPDELAIAPSGNLFTFTMNPNQHAIGSATEFDTSLNEVKTWPSIRFSNPYLQYASITLSTGTPHIWAVASEGGKATLQEIVLQ